VSAAAGWVAEGYDLTARPKGAEGNERHGIRAPADGPVGRDHSVGVIITVVVVLWHAQRSAERQVRSPEFWERRRLESDSLLRDLDRQLAEGEIDRAEYEQRREKYRAAR